jgi:hypothetical protein
MFAAKATFQPNMPIYNGNIYRVFFTKKRLYLGSLVFNTYYYTPFYDFRQESHHPY